MSEKDRINFIIQRDGAEEAKAWAIRTMRCYRTAVLNSAKRKHPRPHFASTNVWRETFIRSYLELKRFVLSC